MRKVLGVLWPSTLNGARLHRVQLIGDLPAVLPGLVSTHAGILKDLDYG